MTALNKQALREAAQEEIMLRSVSDTSDSWQDEASPEAVLALLDELEALKLANAAQDDHINQQQDRIDLLEKGNNEAAKQINSWRRLAKQNIAEREKDVSELNIARKQIAELEAREVVLPPLNDDLIAILGRPNFTCSHLAELMRKSGDEIRRKSEHEQAAVIHWFLGIYLEHGDKWEGVAKADIQSRVAAAGIGVKEE
ncbi:hypothetical protein I5398_11895 [Citrobacter freundii]|nr:MULTISPECIES: hypothetical protein [Citrobacter]MBJ8796730.1 hypothetical protein [Citrobacter freundii]MDM2915093.1 hypothetical protein [Citrobacter sp. Cpo035]MDV1612771.1 hypothetical protein [Citrobacter portucalensis]MEB0546911.1 hypothetical protein [Citrobacter portucalensis]